MFRLRTLSVMLYSANQRASSSGGIYHQISEVQTEEDLGQDYNFAEEGTCITLECAVHDTKVDRRAIHLARHFNDCLVICPCRGLAALTCEASAGMCLMRNGANQAETTVRGQKRRETNEEKQYRLVRQARRAL